MVNSIEIEYLEPKTEFRVGSVKNIAVPTNNVNDIKKMYPSSKKTESNADMLSQSFNQTPEITPIPSPTENTQVESVDQPVQISPIPVVQNTNLEKEPVNLDMNISVSEVPSIEPIVSEVAPIEPINIQNTEPVVEAPIKETNNIVVPNEVAQNTTPIMESAFKVSDAPNIFDNPNLVNNIEKNSLASENNNIFNQPNETKKEIVKLDNLSEQKSDLDDDIISLEIAILEKNVNLYEELAENNRKFIELKKKQIKKSENDVNLENTASNLFNNNGVLDEEQVLGETPMPTLRAA